MKNTGSILIVVPIFVYLFLVALTSNSSISPKDVQVFESLFSLCQIAFIAGILLFGFGNIYDLLNKKFNPNQEDED